MKTVIEMARLAGLIAQEGYQGTGWFWVENNLEHFAELVRADEREKYKWDVHSCGLTCTKVACVAMRDAVEAEREACAKVCESKNTLLEWPTYAAAIRARSNT